MEDNNRNPSEKPDSVSGNICNASMVILTAATVACSAPVMLIAAGTLTVAAIARLFEED